MGRVSTPRRRWAWWHRQRPATRQTLRGIVAVVVTGLLALMVGVSTAHVEAPLGPHEAAYDVTLDQEVRLDLGPLGAVILESPLPWPLGVDVVVAEIPAGELQDGDSPLPGLLADVEAYAQLFTVPEAAVADAAYALVADALGRTVVGWSLLLAALAVGRLASRGRLREELKAGLARPGVTPLVAATALAAAAIVVAPAVDREAPEGRPIAALAGTALEGTRVTGRLGEVVDTYGGVVREAFDANAAFYDALSDGLTAAYRADDEPRAPSGPPDPVADADETAEHAPPSAAEEDGSAEPSAEPTEEPSIPTPEPVTFLHVSDLHCNVGMADVIARAVELSGAEAVLDTGDTVISGTSVESFCINAFAGALDGAVPWVVATGNHDSVTTAEQERSVGFTVLDGTPVDVAGVRVLGDTDPTLTSIGAGTVPERAETVAQMGERLADTACDDGDVDVLLVHNPRAGEAVMESGCVPLQLSGHWHRTVGPEMFGNGVRYVSTSSGGGAGGGATMGPLQSEAQMTVVRIDAATGTPLDHRIIAFTPDATVTLGQWRAFPSA